jgi:hypothetical protein
VFFKRDLLSKLYNTQFLLITLLEPLVLSLLLSFVVRFSPFFANNDSPYIFAENDRFSFFVSACSMTADGEKIWDTISEYKDDISELANRFATEMIHIIYDGTQELLAELEKVRPENIWYKDQALSIEETKQEEPGKKTKKSKKA